MFAKHMKKKSKADMPWIFSICPSDARYLSLGKLNNNGYDIQQVITARV